MTGKIEMTYGEFAKALIDAYRRGLCDGAGGIDPNESTPATDNTNANGNGESHKALSTRERAVLRGLVDGESNKIIARRLVMTESTVKVHMKAILRKLRMPNRTAAAVWAKDNTLLVNGAAT